MAGAEVHIATIAPGSWERRPGTDGGDVVEVSFPKARDAAGVARQLVLWLAAIDDCRARFGASVAASPLLRPELQSGAAATLTAALNFSVPAAVGRALLPPSPTPAQIFALLAEVGAALDALHAQHFMHGALGLDSIWRMPDGSLRLPDASLAHVLQGLVPAPTEAGAYLAPELWRGGGAVPASDQYALAVIAHELFTGHSRVAIDDEGMVSITPLALDHDAPLYPGAPASQHAAMLRALSTAPAARFPSCTAFIDALRGGQRLEVAPPAARVVRAAGQSGGSGSMRTVALAAVACLAVVAMGFAVRAGIITRRLSADLTPTVAATAPVRRATPDSAGADTALVEQSAAAKSSSRLGPQRGASGAADAESMGGLRLRGPDGARFYIDGVLARPTREMVRVPEGEHDVMIVVPNRPSVRHRVTVHRGETVQVPG